MPSSSKHADAPRPRRTPEQTVFLALQRAADRLMSEVAQTLKPADLSPTQYNVLRILRAAGDAGLPCGRIAGRMLTRDPDMTRLLDRLEKRGLIERWRDADDRRVVRGRLAPAGAKLLASFDKPIADLHRRQLGRLGRERLKTLADLLDVVRRGDA